MSKRTMAVTLFLIIAVAILCSSCQSQKSVMSDGPGMLYFFSPT